ncbi:DAZ-associated protein 2, partial [Varanus komodoensis]
LKLPKEGVSQSKHTSCSLAARTLMLTLLLLGQYPPQPSYSVQPPGNPSVFPQTIPLPQAPPYTEAPPAYSELYRPSFVHPGAATVPTMSAAYPGASLYLPMAQSVAMGPMGSSVPVAFYPVGPVYPPGSTVLVEGAYDAGARFAPGAPANIPVKVSIQEAAAEVKKKVATSSDSNETGRKVAGRF